VLAKITSDQAKPNGVLWVVPGTEARFLAPLDVRKMPGVGKVTEQKLHSLGLRTLGQLAQLPDSFLEEHFGAWGLALAAKARGEDAGGWYDEEIGEDDGPKSISHEHTFSTDSRDQVLLETTLLRLCEMVARRLREHQLFARTIQLKLRYSDFSTFTRAHTPERATQLDNELYAEIRRLFRDNWEPRRTIRLLGVTTSGFKAQAGQLALLDGGTHDRWEKAFTAADQLRDKFGEQAIVLGTALKRKLRERVHENPAGLPGKKDPSS
ncbi:MAG: DNA polymerase IV, partial [Terriglobales bacterium]